MNPKIEELDRRIAAATRRCYGAALKNLRHRSTRLAIELFEQLCLDLDVDLLVECGAHEATASRRFVTAKSNRSALAVEANPITFAELTEADCPAGVICINAGVGATASTMTLHVPRQTGSDLRTSAASSFRARANGADVIDEFEVEVATVDLLLSEHPDARVALWIDAEGQGLEVLQGASELLSTGCCRVIFIEVETHAYWEGQGLAADIDRLFTRHGFWPVARDAQSVFQFNVIYVSGDVPPASTAATVAYWRAVDSKAFVALQRVRYLQVPGARRLLRRIRP